MAASWSEARATARSRRRVPGLGYGLGVAGLCVALVLVLVPAVNAQTTCPAAPMAPLLTDSATVQELRHARREQVAWCLHHDNRLTALQVNQEQSAEAVRSALWFLGGLVVVGLAAPLLNRVFTA